MRVEVRPARSKRRPQSVEAETGIVGVAKPSRERKEFGSGGRAVAAHQRTAQCGRGNRAAARPGGLHARHRRAD